MRRDPALVPLSHDHHRTLARARALRRAATGEPAAAQDAAVAFAAHFDAEMAPHFAAEERLLLPLLGPEHPFAARTLAEHAEIRARVDALRRAATPDDLAALGRLVAAHVRFEEREAFEEVQRRADPAALQAVARGLAER